MLSSPLLIDKLNVPAVVLSPVISYLKLSREPDFRDPSENCKPPSVAPVELFKTIPSASVFSVNAVVPDPSVPPLNAAATTSSVIAPEPVSIVS